MGCVRDFLWLISLPVTTVLTAIFIEIRPNVTVVLVGSSTVLRCVKEADAPTPVDWFHRPVGGRKTHIYSSALVDFENSYEDDMSIDYNASSGNYDLLIHVVKPFHAGTFLCVDTEKDEKTALAELVVIDFPPVCNWNLSIVGGDVLGENSCGLEPDTVKFSCDVRYRGNQRPRLTWHNNNDNNTVVSDLPISIHDNNNNYSSQWFIKSNMMNDTRFVCRVTSFSPLPDQGGYNCTSPPVEVIYIQNSSMVLNVSTKSGPISCAINTNSRRCSHTWISLDGSHKTEIIKSPVLDLNDVTVNRRYQCFATCEINNRLCTVSGQTLHIIESDEVHLASVRIAASVCGCLLFVAVVVMCATWVYKRHSRDKQNVSNGDIQLTNLHARNLKSHKADLLGCLDVEFELADYLCSREFLTDEDCKHLKGIEDFRKQNDAFYSILQRKLAESQDPEELIKTFIDALCTTGQEHVANVLEADDLIFEPDERPLSSDELFRITTNSFYLLRNIDLDGTDFLNRLVERKAIRNSHYDRIAALKDNTSKTKELLSIIKRGSYAHFTAFKTCLQTSSQSQIVPALEHGTVLPMQLRMFKAKQNPANVRRTASILRRFSKLSNLEENSTGVNNSMESLFSEVKKLKMSLVGVESSGSHVIVKIHCDTIDAVESLWTMHNNKQLSKLFEDMIRTVINQESSFSLSLDETEFQQRLEDCRSKQGGPIDIRLRISGGEHIKAEIANSLAIFSQLEQLKTLLSQSQIDGINGILRDLKKLGVSLTGASEDEDGSSRSFTVFFLCDSLEEMQTMNTSKQLIQKLKDIINNIPSGGDASWKIKTGQFEKSLKSAHQKCEARRRQSHAGIISEIEKAGKRQLSTVNSDPLKFFSEPNSPSVVRNQHTNTILPAKDERTLPPTGLQKNNDGWESKGTNSSVEAQTIEAQFRHRISIQKKQKDRILIGLAWLENKIFVLFSGGSKILVFSDEAPFDRLEAEEVEIVELEDARDMVACRSSPFLFVSEAGFNHPCLWQVHVPAKVMSRFEVEGVPFGLSSSADGKLMVVVTSGDVSYLNIYETIESGSDMKPHKRVPFPVEIRDLSNVVQSSRGTFVVAYRGNREKPGKKGNWTYNAHRIGEFSDDGRILRSVDLINHVQSDHLSMAEDDQLLIADAEKHEVFLFGPQLIQSQICFDFEKPNRPRRLCYVQDKQELLVGDCSLTEDPRSAAILVFNLVKLNTGKVHQ